MITLSCDKKGCEAKMWFESYWQEPYENGKPKGVLYFPLSGELTMAVKQAFPGNQYADGKWKILCKQHTEQLSLLNTKRQNEIQAEKIAWFEVEDKTT